MHTYTQRALDRSVIKVLSDFDAKNEGGRGVMKTFSEVQTNKREGEGSFLERAQNDETLTLNGG